MTTIQIKAGWRLAAIYAVLLAVSVLFLLHSNAKDQDYSNTPPAQNLSDVYIDYQQGQP